MASDEAYQLRMQIAELAGRVNRAKNGQDPDPQSSHFGPPSRSYSYDDSYRSGRRGSYSRGYARGGRQPQVHRNRTLVMNGSNTSTPPNGVAQNESEPQSAGGIGSGQGFVTRTDRHLQLINTSIFEKDAKQRARAIEETRQQKLRRNDERERTKLTKALGRMSAIHAPNIPAEITVQGIQFRVLRKGSKLVKVPGDLNAAKYTPRTALIGGVRFYRSKNGNLYRSGVVKAYRRTGVKKISEPCKMFTTTGIPLSLETSNSRPQSGGASRVTANTSCHLLGSCTRGPQCPYIHDPSKVAVCTEFLRKGTCPSGDQCDLSHDLTPERTPSCLHFAKGNCSNPNCRYTHVRVSPGAPVCRLFGIYGYCDKGASCTERHVNECPDFSNTGTCKTKGCKLLHRHKASVMRINTNSNPTTRSGDQSPADASSDLSSDEEDEEIGSDDVDSDDLDEGEFFGDDDGVVDEDIPMQQDYVHFS